MTNAKTTTMQPISEKSVGWGPTFDVTNWSYIDFSDIRDAFTYTQNGKTLLEFPAYIRTLHVQEDIEELINR